LPAFHSPPEGAWHRFLGPKRMPGTKFGRRHQIWASGNQKQRAWHLVGHALGIASKCTALVFRIVQGDIQGAWHLVLGRADFASESELRIELRFSSIGTQVAFLALS